MGTATAPVALSASWPAWIWSVSKRWDMLLPLFAFRRDYAVVWLAHGRFSPAPVALPERWTYRFRIQFAAESGAARAGRYAGVSPRKAFAVWSVPSVAWMLRVIQSCDCASLRSASGQPGVPLLSGIHCPGCPAFSPA